MQSNIKVKFHFKCIIGILDFERKQKQKIIIKAKVRSYEFLNYADLICIIKKYYKKQKFYTLEESLEFTCSKLKEDFPSLNYIKLQIYKPKIIKNAKVGIEIEKIY